MPTGKIKWFNPKKGYGFIDDDSSDKDVFVHVSELPGLGMDINWDYIEKNKVD